MAMVSLDAKTIDDLKELGKLAGNEKFVVSNGTESKKVSVNTVIGYAASVLHNAPVNTSLPSNSNNNGQNIILIPEGQEIPVSERTPGTFYLEEKRQTSIRTKVNIPTSVTVSKSLGLKRV